MASSLPCYYALGGINFKNGYATSCPQQTDRLFILDNKNYLPSKFFNSPKFLQHRLDLLNGRWPKGCDMCQHVEEQGAGKSMRQDLPAEFDCVNTETGEVDFAGLKTVEIRFSHVCNMACLHCSEVFSSNWMAKLQNYTPDEDDRKYKLIQLTKEYHRNSKDDDLTISLSVAQSIEIAEDLNANFPNIERIDFSGGEVLYQKQFLPTLEKLAEHPNAENIEILFHTNFNVKVDLKKLHDILLKFGKVSMHISVDAGERIYSYFRNGDWSLLKSNIQEFKSYFYPNNTININLVCTTGVYQIMDLEDVVRSFLTLDAKHLNFSIIYTPFYLNPAMMKIHFNDYVIKSFENARKIIDEEHQWRKNNLKESKKLYSYDSFHRDWWDIYTIKESLDNLEVYVQNHQVKESDWISFIKYTQKVKILWKKDFNDFFENYKLTDTEEIKRINNV
jgi:MoaA/NifB/PqqE/SkfB family radical SAM enzyme